MRWLLLVAGVVVAAPAAAAPATVRGLDGAGKLLDHPRASLQRTPPSTLVADPTVPHGDPDALRYVIESDDASMPATVSIASLSGRAEPIDVLRTVALGDYPCPHKTAGRRCAVTAPIRAVADAIDARHPLVRDRSVVAELGGVLQLTDPAGATLAEIRVAGPRNTPLGAIDRYRAKLRVTLVRLSKGGALPVGGDDAKAQQIARAALRRANALWGACGISFGHPDELEIRAVDPPPAHLLSLGCDYGLPSSGGNVRFRIAGEEFAVALAPGLTPAGAARRVATELRAAGYEASVSDNAAIAAGALGSADVSVRKDGALVTLSQPARGTVSDDPTMTACIGHVHLEDGLQHFGDVDAVVGTLEERTLLKALLTGHSRSVDVIIIPGFGRGGRIGESFIGSDRGTLRNVVVIDRAAVRANRSSFTWAHELGHVLLDDPGHPDDFGEDTPTLLMDADAANGSAFGPRRLTIEECVRAVRQSGPMSRTPLLEAWPIE